MFTSDHFTRTWSTDNTVTLRWTGATDGTGSGLAGYAVAWAQTPTSVPTATLNVSSTTTTSPLLHDGSWYAHVRTQDRAGNWSATAVHYGPFFIDVSPPTVTGLAVEASKVISGTWQRTIADPRFTWPAVTDPSPGSGLAGYQVYWGPNPAGEAPTTWVTTPAFDPPALSSPSVAYLRLPRPGPGWQPGTVADRLHLPLRRHRAGQSHPLHTRRRPPRGYLDQLPARHSQLVRRHRCRQWCGRLRGRLDPLDHHPARDFARYLGSAVYQPGLDHFRPVVLARTNPGPVRQLERCGCSLRCPSSSMSRRRLPPARSRGVQGHQRYLAAPGQSSQLHLEPTLGRWLRCGQLQPLLGI